MQETNEVEADVDQTPAPTAEAITDNMSEEIANAVDADILENLGGQRRRNRRADGLTCTLTTAQRRMRKRRRQIAKQSQRRNR